MFREKKTTCADAREQDMVSYLSSLGIEPVKIKGNDFWYLSPLRDEQTPSFKVNRKLNKWYDHGIGKGGNVIDFAVIFHDCTVADFLNALGGSFVLQEQKKQVPKVVEEPQPKIEIVSDKPLFSEELLNYLRERKIDLEIASQYCREVNYSFNGSRYYSIGFRNNSGGWELRNRYFKGSSSPKDFTLFNNGSDTILVFEGFSDFLSYLTISKGTELVPEDYLILKSLAFLDGALDYLILNSLAFLNGALDTLETYKSKRLFLDNDKAGTEHTLALLGLDESFKDESNLYRNYKDLNDFCGVSGLAFRFQ